MGSALCKPEEVPLQVGAPLDKLVQQLNSGNGEEQQQSLVQLHQIAAKPALHKSMTEARVAQALAGLLQPTEPALAASAGNTLNLLAASNDNSTAITANVARLKASGTASRLAAAQALCALASKPGSDVPAAWDGAVPQLMTMLGDPVQQEAAVKALCALSSVKDASCLYFSPSVVTVLMPLTQCSASPAVQMAATQAVANLSEAYWKVVLVADGVAGLFGILQAGSVAVQVAAMRALWAALIASDSNTTVQLPADAGPQLVAMLRSSNAAVSSAAALVLNEISGRYKRKAPEDVKNAVLLEIVSAVSHMVSLLQSTDQSTREAAEEMLDHLAEEGHHDALINAGALAPLITAAGNAGDRGYTRGAYGCLANNDQHFRVALQAAIALLRSSSCTAQAGAAWCLSQLSSEHEPDWETMNIVVPTLMQHLHSSDTNLQLATACTLKVWVERFGSELVPLLVRETNAVAELIRLMASSNTELQAVSASAAAAIVSKANLIEPSIVQPLIQLLKSSESYVLMEANTALKVVFSVKGNQRTIANVVLQLLRSADNQQQADAAHAVCCMFDRGEDEQQRADADEWVSKVAVIVEAGGLPVILHAFTSGKQDVSEQLLPAVWALAEHGDSKVKEALISGGAVATLAAVLKAAESTSSQLFALDALACLLKHDNRVSATLVSTTEQILQESSIDAQWKAVKFVLRAADVAPDAICDSNIIPLLVACSETDVVPAVAALAKHERSAARLVEAGVVPQLMEKLKRQLGGSAQLLGGSSVELDGDVACVLAALGSSNSGAREILHQGYTYDKLFGTGLGWSCQTEWPLLELLAGHYQDVRTAINTGLRKQMELVWVGVVDDSNIRVLKTILHFAKLSEAMKDSMVEDGMITALHDSLASRVRRLEYYLKTNANSDEKNNPKRQELLNAYRDVLTVLGHESWATEILLREACNS